MNNTIFDTKKIDFMAITIEDGQVAINIVSEGREQQIRFIPDSIEHEDIPDRLGNMASRSEITASGVRSSPAAITVVLFSFCTW